MDPNQYYNQQSNARSLSSATDSRYQDPRYQQYLQSRQTAGYAQQPGQAYGQDVQSRSYYSNDQRHVAGQAIPPSASYPGAVPHQMAYAGSHAVSAPGGTGYPSHGQTPLAHSQSTSAGSGYHNQLSSHHTPSHSYASQHPPSSSYTSQYIPTPAQSVQLPHGRYHASSSSSQYAPPASPEIERFPCDKCDKTFSRAHDRKRHYESQHSTHPYLHRCRFCNKEFSRADSLKRHIDNGCEKDPSFQPE